MTRSHARPNNSPQDDVKPHHFNNEKTDVNNGDGVAPVAMETKATAAIVSVAGVIYEPFTYHFVVAMETCTCRITLATPTTPFSLIPRRAYPESHTPVRTG
jgi:hypothetical protein